MSLPLTYFETSMRQEHPPVWPLPVLGWNDPVVVPGLGCDMYNMLFGYTPKVVMPKLVPVFAVGNGDVTRATDDQVVVHHLNGFETHYAQLAHVLVKPRKIRARRPMQSVAAGQVIGFIEAGMTMSFQIWRRQTGHAYKPVKIHEHMRYWRDTDWTWPSPPDLSHITEEFIDARIANATAANDNQQPAEAAA